MTISKASGQNHDRIGLSTTRGQPKAPRATPKASASKDGVSESGRYECETCGKFFCIDCDVFAHEIVHNCPGCQSREGELMAMYRESGDGDGAMAVDGP